MSYLGEIHRELGFEEREREREASTVTLSINLQARACVPLCQHTHQGNGGDDIEKKRGEMSSSTL